MKEDVLSSKSMLFSVQILDLVKDLRQKHETIVSQQIGRSGTSIGANIHEAQFAQSRADFIAKLQIALKEANETRYWLELLQRSGNIDAARYQSLDRACASLVALLVASLKTAKSR